MPSRLGGGHSKKGGGFALVITLIMVALAAVIVVALLTSATTDRTTSKSVADRFQAELAVRNGLEAAKKALSTDGSGTLITNDDTFTIVRVPDPATTATSEDTKPHYYFVGQLKGLSNTVKYFPLYSGGPAPAAVSSNTLPSYSLSDPSKAATNLPVLLPDPLNANTSLLPQVTTQWIELSDPNVPPPAPTLRYCYWIEDLGGYVDASTAGNTNGVSSFNQPVHTRALSIMQPLIDSGTARTSLISIATLFNPAALDPGGAPQQVDNQNLVQSRPLYFTSHSVRQIVSDPSQTAIARHVIANTGADQEQAVIPFGLGYGQAGAAKTDLNPKIAAKDVDGIAGAITSNLIGWAAGRRGGFGGAVGTPGDDSYRRSIAANIIAYAQPVADAPPTGADYRAVGPYPFVNEFYDYFNWTGVSTNSITVEVTSYVELWNMSNQPISGTIRFTDYYRHRVDVGLMTYFGDNHDPATPDSGETVSGFPVPTQNVSLQGNEFQFIKFGPLTYTLSTGGTIPASPITLQFTKTGRYKLEWQSANSTSFVTIDEPGGPQPLGGIQMASNTVYNPGTTSKPAYKWNGTTPGFSYYGGIATFYYNPGDPRSSSYNSAPQAANNYNTNVTPWSRNAKPTSTVVIGQEVKPSIWSDEGHDTAKINPVGLPDTQAPPLARPPNAPAIESTKAPMFISGIGSLKSIGELGNIFDPAQWNVATPGNKWSDIDSAAPPDQHYGGGMTLRIGRREFTKFATNALRASALLDTFVVGTRRETKGLININTATREALRALGAGLVFVRDPDIQPPTLKDNQYPPYISTQADKFADAIVFTRSTQPFVSTSQLTQIQDSSGNPLFGNKAQWTVPQTAPLEWNDSAAEEYFSRVVDLSSVRSRNFRIFVTGQYVDPRFPDPSGQPKVLATVKRVFQAFLQPARAADGSVQSQKMNITYEQNL